MYPHNVVKRRLNKNVTAVKNTFNNRMIIGLFVFCLVRVLWKESSWLFLPSTPFSKSLLYFDISCKAISNSELDTKWKESIVVYFKTLSIYYWRNWRKTIKRWVCQYVELYFYTHEVQNTKYTSANNWYYITIFGVIDENNEKSKCSRCHLWTRTWYIPSAESKRRVLRS